VQGVSMDRCPRAAGCPGRASRRLSAAGLLLGAVAITSTAPAAEHPQDRKGFTVGFRAGIGYVAIDPEGTDERSGAVAGGSGTFRIGYAPGARWLLTASASGWTNESFGVKQSVSLIGLEAAWFPRGGGFWLEGMAGPARARFRTRLDGRGADVDTRGWGIRIGGGYEWRLTRTFALGPAVDLTRARLDAATMDWVDLSAAFHWYP